MEWRFCKLDCNGAIIKSHLFSVKFIFTVFMITEIVIIILAGVKVLEISYKILKRFLIKFSCKFGSGSSTSSSSTDTRSTD
jgi:hypothetical protein